nr:site-specific DNA-methyltransferase [Mycoplasma testudineum]
MYIDPPYNTESAKDDGNSNGKETNNSGKFIYKDKFARTGWLNMMNERLRLARDLLSESGVIFVSIDDTEQAYLKVLMDEIFGEDNFIATFIWEKNYAPKNNSKFVSVNHDYILCFSKNKAYSLSFKRLERSESNNKPYNKDDNDGKGPYRLSDLTVMNKNKSSKNRYDIHYNGNTYKLPSNSRNWRYNQTEMNKLILDGKIYFSDKVDGVPAFKRYLKDVEGVVSKTILPHNIVGHTDSSAKALNSIFDGDEKFSYPKPIQLISYLIKLVPNNENAIVLDFFAGSGTTGHSVMQLNLEDGGKRKFILSTNNENNIGIDITYERLLRITTGTNSDGINIEWANGKESKYFLNEKIRTYKINHFDISLENNLNNSQDILEKIINKVTTNLKTLSSNFIDDENILFKLNSLHPYKQEYTEKTKDESNR